MDRAPRNTPSPLAVSTSERLGVLNMAHTHVWTERDEELGVLDSDG